MASPAKIAQQVADLVVSRPAPDTRQLIALAGPPATGKSTVSAALIQELSARGRPAGLVAMDGFHLDNAILDARGLRARKGSPESFDLAGFAALLHRLHGEDEVIAPRFDRARDVSVGSSVVITAAQRTVVVEGNYLLLDEPGWRDLHGLWDVSVFLSTSEAELERRLMARWLEHGMDEAVAREKTHANDLPNAQRILRGVSPADLLIGG